ncbi:MAG: ribonuclease Y [Gemmatimonadales bacterium]
MPVDLVAVVIAVLGGAIFAGTVFYFFGRKSERRSAETEGRSAKHQAERQSQELRREAETIKAQAALQGREEALKAREAWDREVQKRREDFERQENRLDKRDKIIDRKMNTLDDREKELKGWEEALEKSAEKLERRDAELADLIRDHRRRLEQVSGLSTDEARRRLIKDLEADARAQASALVRKIKEEAQQTAEREARKIVSLAIQRMAPVQAAEESVAAVALPNDEMKGRIIGREGRNIRAFETATGVDVIIDDTPDTVIISCFDPVRREVGRLALEQLISDGRIHPTRIEEIANKVQKQVDEQIVEAGEQAVYELGIRGMHSELVNYVGRMKYRTSYGQNMLRHSVEVAWLAATMAAELKLDAQEAKRGALLHDIGKVLTYQHEGTHVELGVELATKYGEDPLVINCIAAHHDDVPHESPISVIVQAADAASGARPGARREAVETYVKRLRKLEEIASSFKGVEKCYAIQAGRELRIVVSPNSVDDERTAELSEEIARRLENDVQYPGQIKVVVIRETRAVDFAR